MDHSSETFVHTFDYSRYRYLTPSLTLLDCNTPTIFPGLKSGGTSLRSWLHRKSPTVFIHPLFNFNPAFESPRASFQSSLRVPKDWAGGYWNVRYDRACNLGEAELALSENPEREIGGDDEWLPVHWRLRSCVIPSLCCPTVNPINARHLPILEKCDDLDGDALKCLEILDDFTPFLSYEACPPPLYSQQMLRGLLPCFMYKSILSCECCRVNGHSCYHISTLPPTTHGVPLQCMRCVISRKTCVFKAELRNASSISVQLQARFLPDQKSTSVLDTLWFEGIEDLSDSLIKIDDITFNPHRDEDQRYSPVPKSNRVRGGDEILERTLRSRWCITGKESLSELEKRERILPAGTGGLPLIELTIPLSHLATSVLSLGMTGLKLDDLPQQGTAIFGDLSLITVHGNENPTLSILCRGDHVALETVIENFPEGLALRYPTSSTAFDLQSRRRLQLKPEIMIKSSDPHLTLANLHSTNTARGEIIGWDDISRSHRDLIVLRHCAKNHPLFSESWLNFQRQFELFLSRPAVRDSLSIRPEIPITVPNERGLYAPALLGLDPDKYPTLPMQLNDSFSWSDAETSYSLLLQQSLLTRIIVAAKVSAIERQWLEVVRVVIGSKGWESQLADWKPSIPAGQCRMMLGLIVDDPLGDDASHAWSIHLPQGVTYVYNGLPAGEEKKSKRLHYQKCFRQFLARYYRPPHEDSVDEVQMPYLSAIFDTPDVVSSTPIALYLIHIILSDPNRFRKGIDRDDLENGSWLPPPGQFPLWISRLRAWQRYMVTGGVGNAAWAAIQHEIDVSLNVVLGTPSDPENSVS